MLFRSRAKRRQDDLLQEGIHARLEQLIEDIQSRDEYDSHRSHSPLRKADDAMVLDTSTMTIGQQVEFILSEAKEILERQQHTYT